VIRLVNTSEIGFGKFEFSSDTSVVDVLTNVIEELEGEDNVYEILKTGTQDVVHLQSLELPIIPILHYSTASAIHTMEYLRTNKPKCIFVEGPEDLNHLVDDLMKCELPVSLQGIGIKSKFYPPDKLPVSVIFPLAETSAEYQAIKYGIENKIPVVFVDHTCDSGIRWDLKYNPDIEENQDTSKENDGLFKISVGKDQPTKQVFIDTLLDVSKMHSFSEWILEILEPTLLSLEFDKYQQLMTLIGSIFRRLGTNEGWNEQLTYRDGFMWTRMRAYLRDESIDPTETVYICGASHGIAISESFGLTGIELEIQEDSDTRWHYGIAQSSFNEIEAIQQQMPGFVSEMANLWTMFHKNKKTSRVISIEQQAKIQEDKLIAWSADIVKNARKFGYQVSTADSIAIVKIAYLLKDIREKPLVSQYDFVEAVITCLDKGESNSKSIQVICEDYFRRDKLGKVGYLALPPLVKDVIDRLSLLNMDVNNKKIFRALMDFNKNPEFRIASDLLWLLHYLQVDVRPIMGEKKLGNVNKQESWDINIGKNQNSIIILAAEGMTIEDVFRKRIIRKSRINPSVIKILECIVDVYTFDSQNSKLLNNLGNLLSTIITDLRFEDTLKIYKISLDLINYFRAQVSGIPDWFSRYILNGYQSFSKELSRAFLDDTIQYENLAGMLSFIFKFENIAISQGANRNELRISLQTIYSLKLSTVKRTIVIAAMNILTPGIEDEFRLQIKYIINNPLTINNMPEVFKGLFISSIFSPNLILLIAELLDRCFRTINDEFIIQWIPQLITMLRDIDSDLFDKLIKEITKYYATQDIQQMKVWYNTSIYEQDAITTNNPLDTEELEADIPISETNQLTSLIQSHPTTTNYWANYLGLSVDSWLDFSTLENLKKQKTIDKGKNTKTIHIHQEGEITHPLGLLINQNNSTLHAYQELLIQRHPELKSKLSNSVVNPIEIHQNRIQKLITQYPITMEHLLKLKRK